MKKNEEVKLAVQFAKMYSEKMATKTENGWLASENIGETYEVIYFAQNCKNKLNY